MNPSQQKLPETPNELPTPWNHLAERRADRNRRPVVSWTKLSSRTVFENPWMRVLEDHVINPGGGENLYGYIHFRNIAVGILPIDDEDHTWLVGQQRYTLGEYSWELPMGGAPLTERPLDAAKRELQEETGLTAACWTELMRVHTSNSITDEAGVVYVAESLTPGKSKAEETEDLAVRRLPLDEAITMAVDGRITDAISVAALLKAALARTRAGR